MAPEGAPAEAPQLDPAALQSLTDPAQLAAYQAMLQAGAFGFGQVSASRVTPRWLPRWPTLAALASPARPHAPLPNPGRSPSATSPALACRWAPSAWRAARRGPRRRGRRRGR